MANVEKLSLLIVLHGRNQLFPTYNTPVLYCICILFICTHNPPGQHVCIVYIHVDREGYVYDVYDVLCTIHTYTHYTLYIQILSLLY